jgi:hypothetical protein
MPERSAGSLGAGFGIGAICNVLALIAAIAWVRRDWAITGFGLVQLAWQLPLWAFFQFRHQRETAKGVLLALGITILLSAACWSFFLIISR